MLKKQRLENILDKCYEKLEKTGNIGWLIIPSSFVFQTRYDTKHLGIHKRAYVFATAMEAARLVLYKQAVLPALYDIIGKLL